MPSGGHAALAANEGNAPTTMGWGPGRFGTSRGPGPQRRLNEVR